MPKMGSGCFVLTSHATVRAPFPGAGTERPALSLERIEANEYCKIIDRENTYIEVDVNARIPQIGAPNLSAVFALMTIWTPVP